MPEKVVDLVAAALMAQREARAHLDKEIKEEIKTTEMDVVLVLVREVAVRQPLERTQQAPQEAMEVMVVSTALPGFPNITAAAAAVAMKTTLRHIQVG
jgi:hypothetical protein